MSDHRYLFPGLRQLEVDFVIPRASGDIPLCIDPFLLYKSRDPELRDLHALLMEHFSSGVEAIRRGNLEQAKMLFAFPEVPETGLGYGESHRRGSGLGSVLTGLLVDTLSQSPAMVERGVRHVEEMQLISYGIGPDRVSDIASNILKEYLVSYTQRQCAIHGIPMRSGVPITHIFDPARRDWYDAYVDLPTNPVDHAPVLLVPRRIVRNLPWINYDNFEHTEFRQFMRAQQRGKGSSRGKYGKPYVTSMSRTHVTVVENYVKSRERLAPEALPVTPKTPNAEKEASDTLLDRLREMPSGQTHASAYQQLVLDILTFVFFPDLIDGRLEQRTFDGTERRDVIFTNDSYASFFDYVRNTHDALMIMFEAKNVASVELIHVSQAATYLGDRIGRFGCIVTRNRPGDNIWRKQMTVFNDSNPRKVLLVLCDDDLRELVALRTRNESTVAWFQRAYRNFRSSIQ